MAWCDGEEWNGSTDRTALRALAATHYVLANTGGAWRAYFVASRVTLPAAACSMALTRTAHAYLPALRHLCAARGIFIFHLASATVA
jgi:hypothetical protein